MNWTSAARAQLRATNKQNAMLILRNVTRYADTNAGDVKRLKGQHEGRLRLRVGAYRVIFTETAETMTIVAVDHRSEAYR